MYQYFNCRFKLFDEVAICPTYQYADDYRGQRFIVTGVKYDRPMSMMSSYRDGYTVADLKMNIQITELSSTTNKMIGAPIDEWDELDLMLVKRNVE